MLVVGKIEARPPLDVLQLCQRSRRRRPSKAAPKFYVHVRAVAAKSRAEGGRPEEMAERVPSRGGLLRRYPLSQGVDRGVKVRRKDSPILPRPRFERRSNGDRATAG